MLNSAEHEISMLDKSHLTNLLEELLIYRKFNCFCLSTQTFKFDFSTLSNINETLKFDNKLCRVRTQDLKVQALKSMYMLTVSFLKGQWNKYFNREEKANTCLSANIKTIANKRSLIINKI